jgi:alpha-1,2-mannosyltransferase
MLRLDARFWAVWGPRLLWLVALGYLASIAFTLAQYQARANGGLPPGLMEFTPTYGASLQIRDLPAESLYQREPVVEYTKRTLTAMYPEMHPIWLEKTAYPPWLYPPHFILLVVPLALLPYWLAFVLWNASTALPYLAAMGRILPARIGWPLALAVPPVYFNLLQGQTGFLTAGFIGLGLVLLRQRPILAGICIGLASVKPHFGLLLPVALMAGGHWRAALAAAASVAALVLASLLAFGTAPWAAFLASAAGNLQGFEKGTYNFVLMATVLSTFTLAGADMATARLAQFISLLLMMGVVAWVWWRGQSHDSTLGLQGAVLCIATPLALPMAYTYDLVLLAPAIAWLAADLYGRRGRPWEWLVLAGATVGFEEMVRVALVFHFQMGPLLMAVLLALALRRFRLAMADGESGLSAGR